MFLLGSKSSMLGSKSSLLGSKSSLLGLCPVFLKRGLRPLYFLNSLGRLNEVQQVQRFLNNIQKVQKVLNDIQTHKNQRVLDRIQKFIF